MKGIAAKRRNRTPNAKDVYIEKKNTTGWAMSAA
jgi:hypothetical protein